MNKETFKKVIAKLGNEFDSHEFIENFLFLDERGYVELLYAHIESKNGVFRAAHAAIGRCLADNAREFGIRKTERGDSTNIKGYESENQGWEKEK
jgi:hypothetical protein